MAKRGEYMKKLLIFMICLLALVLIACARSGLFDILALVLPLAFQRPVLMVLEFFRKKEV